MINVWSRNCMSTILNPQGILAAKSKEIRCVSHIHIRLTKLIQAQAAQAFLRPEGGGRANVGKLRRVFPALANSCLPH